MNNLLASFLLSIVLVGSSAASDIPTRWGEVSCQHYLDALKLMHERKETRAIEIAETWIYGFVAGQRGETTMKPAVFRRFSDDLFQACVKNRNQLVLEAAAQIEFRHSSPHDG